MTRLAQGDRVHAVVTALAAAVTWRGLRSPEGREFILAEIDDFDREIELTRDVRLMKLLDERAKQTRTIPLAEAVRRLSA